MTVQTVLTVRVFCWWAKISYGQAHRRDRRRWPYETVRADRIWPLVRLLRSVAAVSTVPTVSCYGLYGLCGQLLRLIKAGLDRGGFTSSSAFEGSTSLRCQQRRNSRGFGVTVSIDCTGLTLKTIGSVWYSLKINVLLRNKTEKVSRPCREFEELAAGATLPNKHQLPTANHRHTSIPVSD